MRDTVIDISQWQAPMDFTALRAEAAAQGDNLLGVIIKAYEAGWGVDPMLETHYANARRTPNFRTGFYSFDHINVDPTRSAGAFLDAISTKVSDLGVYDDFEDNNAVGWSGVSVSNHVDTWCDVVEKARPGQVGVYGGAYAAWSPYLQVAPRPFWLAAYTQTMPQVGANLGSPMLWQRSDKYLGRSLDYSVVLDRGRLDAMGKVAPAKPVPLDVKMRIFQQVLHTEPTGAWNDDTAKRAAVIREMRLPHRHADAERVKFAQQTMAFAGLKADGKWGVVTNNAWRDTVRKLQASMGMTALTGLWDTTTEYCYKIMQTVK